MSNENASLINTERRSNWVRLRTLVTLRWIAISGQLASLILAQHIFGLSLQLGGFALVIGASVIVNIISHFLYPENTRLSERGATLMLLFDITQLSALLCLSGGMHNPFAMLILAPVTIAATALQPKSSVLAGGVAIALVSLLVFFHVPLQLEDGGSLVLPDFFLFGQWAATVIGVLFLGLFSWRVSTETHSMSEALLATQMALTREQKLTDLGGVVAAAAHELGTPLATIKLVSSELAEELADNDAFREDAELIREQADRCRDILRSMGQAGKDDKHMRIAPIQAVVEEAAAPHMDRGCEVIVGIVSDTEYQGQPFVYRFPEIIHGLRNLIQNAVDFAETTVWVDISWTDRTVNLRIIDDGAGFPPSVIGRIGDPFVRQTRREKTTLKRPEYEGMGLGLFIAKTLLERTGGEIVFANATERNDIHMHAGRRSGAIVEVTWERSRICVREGEELDALGANAPISVA